MSENEPAKPIIHNPLFWGWGITAVVISLYLGLAGYENCLPVGDVETCASNLEHFLKSRPNEIGDTLAGLAGVLAFLWIIVTVMIQSQELREQREELKQSRHEYAKMSAALEAQAAVFLDEQKQRSEIRAEELLAAQLSRLRDVLIDHEERLVWGYVHVDQDGSRTGSESDLLCGFSQGWDIDGILKHINTYIADSIRDITSDLENKEITKKPQRDLSQDEIVELLYEIDKLEDELSEGQRFRLMMLDLHGLAEQIASVLDDETLWETR